ncbi:hypothetical protein GCK32_011750 [Trichostrongylus colubriformis]|uniref:Uncharacterized protein n=1 Tax=Trichostrongylus colubriformis TaxID=6319 RepID=A0AAN8ID99_TRICO
MTASIEFEIFKQEERRAIRELQTATSTVDLQLLDELRFDNEDRDDLSYGTLVATRQRNLLARISRALHDTQQYWDSLLRSTDRLGDEEQRRNLYEQALLHWQSQGGDQVQREAKSLADQIDIALQLLPQIYTPHLPQVADHQPMTPTQPLQRRSERMTPAASTAINQNPDGNRRWDGKLNAIEYLPQALPRAQACSDEEIRQGQHEPLPQEQFVRLPKFDLPMFAGDIDRFPEFWDAFNSAVHANPTISLVVKFHHLRNLLKGDAQAAVAGYDITQSNYERALKTLQETYYRPQLIRTQLSVKLQTMRPASTSPLHQRTKLAQIRSLWLQHEKLGDHEDNIFVMRLIREKFPQRTLEHLGTIETADPTPWKVPQLLSGLDRAIKTFETIADTAEQTHADIRALALRTEEEARSPSQDSSSFHCHRSRTRPQTSIRRAARSCSRHPCAFCKRCGHATADCHLVTTREARATVVAEERLCRKCFAPTHFASKCDRPPCSLCRRNHHVTLCPKYTPAVQSSGRSRKNTPASRNVNNPRVRRTPTPRSSSSRLNRIVPFVGHVQCL